MSNNKTYELRIIKYNDNTSLYILSSYHIERKSYMGNYWISNLQTILRTTDRYELKIKLNLLGLYFTHRISNKINYDKTYNTSIKSVVNFKLNSSYEN